MLKWKVLQLVELRRAELRLRLLLLELLKLLLELLLKLPAASP